MNIKEEIEPQRRAKSASNFKIEVNKNGINSRIKKLRQESVDAEASISIERAQIVTDFYKNNFGKYPVPIMRALNFKELCQKKTIYIGDGELIVGERGPKPKAVPTFPELTCHSVDDLNTLNTRELQNYHVSPEDIITYERDIIPYWTGRTQRERIFKHVPKEWEAAYEAGVFTEFMEQRAPGHTALDGKIYQKGMLQLKQEIKEEISRLDFLNDAEATDKLEELQAMEISCDAVIIFANRHADLAEEMAKNEENSIRKSELLKIAEVCRNVPANKPSNFHEAIQMYWFVHLGTITELNGWDAMNPGHFDQHLFPFYERDIKKGILNRDQAKELLSCFWIKVNNHPAPPKVGVTARESGTYNDFTNINIGGVDKFGNDAVNEISYMILEIIEELHILQPGSSVHFSKETPSEFVNASSRVIRQGHGYPSIFNTDIYIKELLRQGKSIDDAREGGCSGCIEVGAFGKEAFVLTGYLNVPKILELTLNNGVDPLTNKRAGIKSGDPLNFTTFEDLYSAFQKQLNYIVNQKITVSNYIDRMFAKYSPAPFLSVVIDDCISKGKDYYNAGPRYNTNYIQCTGLGTVTDSLSAIKKHVFEDGTLSIKRLLDAVSKNFKEEEILRQTIINRTPFFGNDDDYADSIAQKVYLDLFKAIDGKPNTKGGVFHLNMLSTTCHIYFGKVLGATPNGRLAYKSISDGTSPSHGCDTNGPSAVMRSLSKIDHTLSGGTLLNQRFLPSLLKREKDIQKLGQLVRTYFKMGGHHIQFNIVDTATLYAAQKNPEDYKDLLVRMAGYSDYFNDMNEDLQQEVIERTENESF
ncbi:MAG: formate C-acetyltransferase/glycerol dehydratase family glycyl radical enzyme [Marinilabiliales bacterium]|nr:MAG: formate C-acetyltransferase/glycerol dehydratase family glycyl radical enzyme [Marinilabiliales bacterium]